MNKKEDKLATMLAVERERIIAIFQNRANWIMERSFGKELEAERNKDSFCKGLNSGYAAAYRLAAIWLQEDIREIREEIRKAGEGRDY